MSLRLLAIISSSIWLCLRVSRHSCEKRSAAGILLWKKKKSLCGQDFGNVINFKDTIISVALFHISSLRITMWEEVLRVNIWYVTGHMNF